MSDLRFDFEGATQSNQFSSAADVPTPSLSSGVTWMEWLAVLPEVPALRVESVLGRLRIEN